MRPVDKQNPPNYSFTTPASTQGVFHTFQAGGAVATVYARAGTKPRAARARQMSFFEITSELLEKKIKQKAFPNQRIGDRTTALRNMENALDYRGAAGDLIAMLSQYCSFCELPVPRFYIEVEHRAPKALCPTYYLLWSNFLLACRQCNTIKANKPARATATGWARARNPTEAQLYAEIEANYFWPDLDDSCYRAFPLQFWCEPPTRPWERMKGAEYASTRNKVAGFADGVVTANVRKSGGMLNSVPVQCCVVQNAATPTIGTDTIDLTGLDRDDERLAQRTLTWLRCCEQFDSLFTGVETATRGMEDRAFETGWDSLLVLAMATGFFSMWLQVLMKRDFPAGVTAAVTGTYATLGEKFVFDTNPANGKRFDQVIQGTDYTEVP